MFTLLSEDVDVLGRVDERDRKVDALAEKIRAMECQNSLGFDVTNMGLVEGLRIPYKFKAPSFDKYNGTSCPRTHVQAYYRKISAYTDDDKIFTVKMTFTVNEVLYNYSIQFDYIANDIITSHYKIEND